MTEDIIMSGEVPFDKDTSLKPIGAADEVAQSKMRRKALAEVEEENSRSEWLEDFKRRKAEEFDRNYRANGVRFAKWLKAMRIAKGISQTELGIRTGITQPGISRIEAGKIKLVRAPTLALIAHVLQISDWEILARAGLNINAKWEFKDGSGVKWEIEKPLGDPMQPIDNKTAELLAVLGFIKRSEDQE